MGDFAQSGAICTLQQLGSASAEWLEAELAELVRTRPVALILPCHAADLEQPALHRLREELAGAAWLSEIVFSLNGLNAAGYEKARQIFAGLPQRVRVLWNDGPTLAALHGQLLDVAAAELPHGKGFNVWAALGLLGATTQPHWVALQDCDVLSFRRSALAPLLFACAAPELDFALAKMYYPRVTDRLYGRVSRLFLAPLLRALSQILGPRELLRFLESFRYPLAGEVALRSTLAERLSVRSGWSLEIGMLCAAFRAVDPHQICQVDGGEKYDHRHQGQVDALTGMCRAIAETLLAVLRLPGATDGPHSTEELQNALRREGALAVHRSGALARMNGLPYNATEEASLARTFRKALLTLPAPPEQTLPPWEKLRRDRPEAVLAYVEAATKK